MASCVLHMELFPDPVQTSLRPGSPHQHHSHGRTCGLRSAATTKRKNTKSLLERRGSMNGALSEHYTSCKYLPREIRIVIIVGLESI